MGNLCSKKKTSDSISLKSEGSTKKHQDSQDGIENHSNESKRPSQNGGATSQAGATAPEGANEGQPSSAGIDIGSGIKGRAIASSSYSGDSVVSPTTVEIPHPFELPLEMTKQTDNVKNLMLGRVSKVKPCLKGRKITLYICASFSQDFRLEKGTFHTQVYPSLREYCSNRGYELHVTDLHWKADLESQQDHQFPELCLEELRRQLEVSYVIPVLFLSNSLGESLLPKTVEQQDFEVNLKHIADSESRGLLEKWYGLDTHAEPPCYRLKPVAAHLPKVSSADGKERNEAIDQWRGIVEQIMGVMLRVFPTELRDTYLTTVIEQEIHNSIFMSREVGKRSIWVNRVFTHIQAGQETCDESNSTEYEKNRRLESLHNELKNQLVSEHILRLLVKWQEGGLSPDHPDHQAYLQLLSTQLSSQLRSIIDDIIEEDKGKAVWKSSYGVDGLLCSELMQHSIFCQQAAKCSIPIENVLNNVKQHISAETNYPLVIHGQKGCGKTCFLSRAVQQCLNWFSDAVVLYRFVGLTPESRSVVQLLRGIVSQLAFLYTGRNYWIPHNVACYAEELNRLISNYAKSTLIIVIDGLDEWDSVVLDELTWLSINVSSRMRTIVSCSDDSSVFQFLKTNIKRDEAFLSLPSPNQQSAEGLLSATLLQYCHSADSSLQSRMSSRLKHCTLPLYIKVLAWQASIDVQGSVDLTTVSDLKTSISNFFNYVEASLGKDKVKEAMALICASRYGLSDSELLDLLASIPEFCSTVTHLDWAPASLFMSQLCQTLGPFLEWSVAGNTFVMRWRDRLLLDVANERYMSNKDTARKTRQNLVNYFQGTLKDKKNGRHISVTSTAEVGNRHLRRKLEEIPYQQFHLEKSIKSTHICNEEWLLSKLRVSSVFNVIEDIALESSGDKSKLDPDVLLLLQTLELSASALSYDGQQLYSQVWGRLMSLVKSDSASSLESCPFMKKLYESCKSPKVPSFIPYSISLLHSPEAVKEANKVNFLELTNGAVYFDQITRLKTGNQFVVSLSTANEEVIVWNVYEESPIRTLRSVHNPVDLKIIDDTRVVILCGRELQICNLDDGSFVSKLKGVMNQKMPYFGLHDDNHIVALSRNRMYVNLMNLTSGECISTFKVGEDRFLNSLIVSENGKILVCGDETQKPFPLLVWDLNSKKLLYDLRIPHHEFLTTLSAITKEGHFVCCVCREVDDSGPNFIVVYDLQSGTLFKKWKPGFSTQAIAISAQGGCVISALEDNRVLVWDLVTGTCKFSLAKHTAPADTLRLDLTGARCLSWDSEGRDRSVCLWDLTTGTLLSLFTPDVPFSACEVSNDGNGLILGMKGKTHVSRIEYKSFESSKEEKPLESFGNKENLGKVIDLKNP